MTVILASTSAGRAAMLRHAGIAFTAVAPDTDETAIKAGWTGPPEDLALALAEAKARGPVCPGAWVIGADQLLVLDDGRRLSKPETPADARAQLARLSGTTHRLISAAAVVRDGISCWQGHQVADMAVRRLSSAFIDAYVAANWDRIRWTVGCYEVEGAGVQLFDCVAGDPWTIMGMPLLPLLGWLRSQGEIDA